MAFFNTSRIVTRLGATVVIGSTIGISKSVTATQKKNMAKQKLPPSIFNLPAGQPFFNPDMSLSHRNFLALLEFKQQICLSRPFNTTYKVEFVPSSDPRVSDLMKQVQDQPPHRIFLGGLAALLAAIDTQISGAEDVVFIHAGNMTSSHSGHQKHLKDTESIFPMFAAEGGDYHVGSFSFNWLRKRLDPTYLPNQYSYSLADLEVSNLGVEDWKVVLGYAKNDFLPSRKKEIIKEIKSRSNDYQRCWLHVANLLKKYGIEDESFDSIFEGGRRKVTFGDKDDFEAKRGWQSLGISNSYQPASVTIRSLYGPGVKPYTVLPDGGFPSDLHQKIFALAQKINLRCETQQVLYHVYNDQNPEVLEMVVTRNQGNLMGYKVGPHGYAISSYGAHLSAQGLFKKKIPYTAKAAGISAIYAVNSRRSLDTYSSTTAGEHFTVLETQRTADGGYLSYVQATGGGVLTGKTDHIPYDVLVHIQDSLQTLYGLRDSDLVLLTCRVCSRPTGPDNLVQVDWVSDNEIAATGAGGTGVSVAPWVAEKAMKMALKIS